jgi:hypothetical protein
MDVPSILCLLQGGYFLLTGIWPIVSIVTFQLVTGPKVDLWLVKTFGVLVAGVGVSLISGCRGNPPAEIAVLGIVTAIGLAAAEINYVLRQRISPVYLADAALEGVFVAGWVWTFFRS